VLYEVSLAGFSSTITGASPSFTFTVSLSALLCIPAALFEVLIFSKIFRKKAFGFTLLTKTLFYLSFIFIFLTIATMTAYSTNLHLPLLDPVVIKVFMLGYVESGRLLLSMTYYAMAVVVALFVVQVSEKFGPGVLLNFLFGKYHRPKEASRIFMFMDLKSSTAYAERLGHIQYSQLIQDCFYDLTDVVAKYGAQIYQYVGDEVVLTWDLKTGLRRAGCLRLFFDYDAEIRHKGDYYEKNFGLVPEFKASLHLGDVTVAEVGELKKELAYHGDVINTASRIQDKCNDYGARMLISEQMKAALGRTDEFAMELVGNVLLKGKARSVKIYKVEPDHSRHRPSTAHP